MNDSVERGVAAGARERLRIRVRDFSGNTAGLAPGNVQANLVILPKALAHDFLRFAQANPKPCPVLGVSEAGDPHLPGLGEDLDIRSDLPRYRVWRRGELVEEPLDLDKPDYGDAVPVRSDELPVFWACGVTPQAVIAQMRPDFCVTHAPGCMLITDLRNTQLASL